ncbi:Rv3654c family TadE-like protein, partial [Asanoa ferruginea]
ATPAYGWAPPPTVAVNGSTAARHPNPIMRCLLETPAVRRRVAGDRGSATIWVLAVGLAFVLLGLACATVGVAAIGRHRAQTAADLGALAGAARSLEGPAAACARATDIAAANGGRVTACAVQGFDVIVTVEVVVHLPSRGIRVATARARAGLVA